MSSSDQTALSNINFTGGYPMSKDLVPSIIFLVIYAVLIPLFVFRLIRKSDRTLILLRPGVFIVCRIGMLVIRAYMLKHTYGEGLLIAELVLVSIGFLFLIEPAVAMWKLHVESATPKEQHPVWVKRLALILKLTVLGAIGTAVIGSSLISSALKNPDQLNTVKALRKVSAVLSFGAAIVVFLATIQTHFAFPVAQRGTIYLLALIVNLIIISVYRMVQTFSTDSNAPVRSAAAFWILQMLFELIAFALILAISIPTWFPGDQTPKGTTSYDLESAQPQFQANAQGRNQYHK